jgi:hypothetical protein
LAYVVLGFSPITALAFAAIGWLPLSSSALFVILPLLVGSIACSAFFPAYGKLALKVLVMGMIATLFYDAMRVPFIISGVWSDFIPKISIELLHTGQPNWAVGYTWRYVGDGGFLALAFAMASGGLKLRVDIRVAAVAFGVAIWACLLITLALTPPMQAILFPLTPTTFVLSLLGHLIYGTTLGVLLHRWGWHLAPIGDAHTDHDLPARLPASAVEEHPRALRCVQCGVLLPEWAHFCGQCGANLEQPGGHP